jgi:ABC-type uncharacterized transport system substrate-binding protein
LGALALALLLSVVGPAVSGASADAVIVRNARGASAKRLARALATTLKEKGVSVRVVELTEDVPSDVARISRATSEGTVLYTIGPYATETARESGGTVVSLDVANPSRVRTPGTYVSMYPRLDEIFRYLKQTLGVSRVGLLFTPAENREIAVAFIKAAQEQGVELLPVAVSSEGKLVRALKRTLPEVDTLLLAVDPILKRDTLEYVVSECKAAGKPSVGFLKDLTRYGVTLSMVLPLDAIAEAAVAAADDPVSVGKKRVEIEDPEIVVSPSGAQSVGLDPKNLTPGEEGGGR